uniref:Uncharacterized protein n=1 Tax=viral metagenome TaxID=1070528 RepID=A0A6M3KUB3_9ZZZZ
MKISIKQYKATKFLILIGGAKEIFARLSFYIQIGTISMVAVSFWDTGIIRGFRAENEWMTFGVFLAIIVLAGLILLTLEYVYVMPGSYAFGNEQFNKHQNEITETVRELKIKQELDSMKLDEIYRIVVEGKINGKRG